MKEQATHFRLFLVPAGSGGLPRVLGLLYKGEGEGGLDIGVVKKGGRVG